MIFYSCKRKKQPERNNEEMAKLAKFKNKNFNLLQPPVVFYLFLYMLGFIIVWLLSGLFSGLFSTDLIMSYVPFVFILPLIVSVISTILIVFFIHVFHYLYLHNVRSAFNNAFLPKVNVPSKIKRVNVPEGFKYDDLKSMFSRLHQDYTARSLQTTARDGGFGVQTKTLPQIMGYEVVEKTRSIKSEEKSIKDETSIREEKSQVSILTCSKLSINDLKQKLQALKESRPILTPQDSARPLISEDILEKVGEEDEFSIIDHNNISIQQPKSKIIEESEGKEQDDLPSINPLQTEEDLLRRQIYSTIK